MALSGVREESKNARGFSILRQRNCHEINRYEGEHRVSSALDRRDCSTDAAYITRPRATTDVAHATVRPNNTRYFQRRQLRDVINNVSGRVRDRLLRPRFFTTTESLA